MSTDQQPDLEQDDDIIGTAFIVSLVVFAALGIAGYVGYQFLKPQPIEKQAQVLPSVLPGSATAVEVDTPALPWSDITDSAGIDFVHENGATGEKLLPETMGGGCAFFDYDGDGDQDLLFVNSNHWPWTEPQRDPPATMKLYANDGTGKFSDVTAAAGLNVSMYGMGAACADYDADGWVDLFISCVGQDRLFHNQEGKFVDVTESAGVGGGPQDWSSSCGWFDYDGDGDLDLFVADYLKWSREYDLAQEFTILGNIPAYGRPQNFEGTFPSLFRNDGEGKFSDVSEEAGFHIINPDTNLPLGKGLGVLFEDFDDDGDIDIFVSNDTVQNFLFVNQSNGKFEEMAKLAGVAFDLQGAATGAMGIDAAHFRNNNALGVAIGNFSNEMTTLYVTRDRNLQFYDEAVSNGLGPATRTDLSFGLLFFDVDLDGRCDLFQANGHLEQEINKVQASQTYEQPPQLFWNAGPEYETEFVRVPAENTGEAFQKPLVGRGASYADIDGDGDLDLLITTTGQKPRLLRNDQTLGHHWLRLKLKGADRNLDAIGARVTVKTGDVNQVRTVSPTRSYISQVELPVTFGLGTAETVNEIHIRWPNGKQQTLKDVKADQLLTVEQPQ